MRYAQTYLGRSVLRSAGGHSAISLSPNLARPKVFFDGELRHPLRFREAMSALHEVVIGDLCFKKSSKDNYKAYLDAQAAEERALHAETFAQTVTDELRKISEQPPRQGLAADFARAHAHYFGARKRWINDLRKRDSKLWWLLDPVITVAPDTVYFECFSKDEASYGCLHIDREAFAHQDLGESGLGTTNVDYSFALYDHFQTMRSYRPTRLQVDPSGFEVQVAGHPDHREDKVDLPSSWLAGFGQIQAAQMLPATHITLPVETVYSLLAFLVRRREKQGPRAIRFELIPGKAPELFLEPWEQCIVGHGRPFTGATPRTVRIWGRRRLLVLARLLPLIDQLDVYLIGSGLPSIWVARMGEMHFTLCLSGWTTNDWAAGAPLQLLAGAYPHRNDTIAVLRETLERERDMDMAQLRRAASGAADDLLLGSLYKLAERGQVIFDHATGRFRYRPVMPEELAGAMQAPAHPEFIAAQAALRSGQVTIQRSEALTATRRLLSGKVGKVACETLLDRDGAFIKARCSCSHFYKNRLRTGPCRHLLALKLKDAPPIAATRNSASTAARSRNDREVQ